MRHLFDIAGSGKRIEKPSSPSGQRPITGTTLASASRTRSSTGRVQLLPHSAVAPQMPHSCPDETFFAITPSPCEKMARVYGAVNEYDRNESRISTGFMAIVLTDKKAPEDAIFPACSMTYAKYEPK